MFRYRNKHLRLRFLKNSSDIFKNKSEHSIYGMLAFLVLRELTIFYTY